MSIRNNIPDNGFEGRTISPAFDLGCVASKGMIQDDEKKAPQKFIVRNRDVTVRWYVQ